jgi:hypothetical protein
MPGELGRIVSARRERSKPSICSWRGRTDARSRGRPNSPRIAAAGDFTGDRFQI